MIRSLQSSAPGGRSAWVAKGLVAFFCALAVVAVAVAALVGWRAGSSTTSSSAPTTSAASRAVRLGAARLTVPSAWTAVSPTRAGVSRLDPGVTLAFSILPSLPGHAILTLGAPADSSLIPGPLRQGLKEPPGRPRPSVVGGHRAWTYQRLATARGTDVMDVAVVPTTAGVLAVACVSSPVVFGAVTGCQQDVQRISVAGARILAPGPEVAFRLQAGPAVEGLNALRARGDADLRAARSRGAQSRALRFVAAAYARTADRLAPLAAAQGDSAEVVAAVRGAGRAYRAAGLAAGGGFPRRYARARTAVRAAEARVGTALGRVTDGGGIR